VDVIDVPLVIPVIAKAMLPETTLPHASFAPLAAALREAFARLDAPGKIALDQTPAGREIGVPGGQGQDAMQMIGQDRDGIDLKWVPLPHRDERGPQHLDMVDQQPVPLSFRQVDREKPGGPWDAVAAVFGHGTVVEK